MYPKELSMETGTAWHNEKTIMALALLGKLYYAKQKKR